MAKVVGIDLGTTNSVAATIEDGKPTIIPNAEGSRLTPSVVAFTKDGKRLVGEFAKRQAVVNPHRTVASIKRRMGSDYKANINNKEYLPQEISAMILHKIKTDAESYLGEEVKQAVITVPAYFNDNQRQATCDAGKIAGLEVLRIVNEPTAGSLAYGLHREDIHTILVWDLGGGTFDVSILELGAGVFEVKATSGNTWLGGDDYDQRIMDYLMNVFQKEHGVGLSKDKVTLQRLKEAAETAKIELSSLLVTNINLPFIATVELEPKHLETTLTRAKFEELTKDLLQKMVGPTKQALADAGLEPGDIDRVILVGGATRMPAVPRLIKRLLGKEPYKHVNPDEVVALGAAIQAGILTGEVKELVLVDVTPLSLGIETQGGIFTKIIERNTTIPTSQGQIFTTARDNQAEVDIHVLQGEREMAADNISLGRFQLADIPLAPRGTPQLEVTFDIDANGIVHVSAKDLHTDNEQRIKIASSTKLSEQEIKRMIKEAQIHAEEDKKQRQKVETEIEANNMIQAAQKVLEEARDIADKSPGEEVEKAVSEVKAALAKGNIAMAKSKTEELKESIKVLYGKVKSEKPGLEKQNASTELVGESKRLNVE